MAFVAAAVIVTGCETTGIFGNSSSKVDKASDRITEVQNKIIKNKDEKIYEVKDFSFATDYSLKKATNKEPAILVAQNLNQRIETILGLPNIEKQSQMVMMVNNLISNNIEGINALAAKDGYIQSLQDEEIFLLKKKDVEIQKALDLSASIALKADTTKSELDKYRGFFGLSAMWIGFKQFLKTAFWGILGFGTVFMILRMLSSVNPIAGAIFSVIDVAFSWVVNVIKVLAPKALTVANTVSGEVYRDAKSALKSVVDAVETFKLQEKASGIPATIEDLLNAAEATMTDTDKAMIERMKVEMGWKKNATTSTVTAQKPVIITDTPTTLATDVQKNN